LSENALPKSTPISAVGDHREVGEDGVVAAMAVAVVVWGEVGLGVDAVTGDETGAIAAASHTAAPWVPLKSRAYLATPASVRAPQ